jgi:hypothetical protein
MKRFLTIVGTGVLAVCSALGAVSAQTDNTVDVDGTYVVASDEGVPIVSGHGDNIIYGSIDTGGARGETLGDPNAVYTSPRPDHPGPGVPVMMPGAGDGLIGGMPIQPAAPDNTTLTTTTLDSTEGTTTENVPLDALAPAPSEPVATEGESTAIGFCAQYGTWYDAQVAYEELGTTAADPALVQEVDADYDGIACEEMMA